MYNQRTLEGCVVHSRWVLTSGLVTICRLTIIFRPFRAISQLAHLSGGDPPVCVLITLSGYFERFALNDIST